MLPIFHSSDSLLPLWALKLTPSSRFLHHLPIFFFPVLALGGAWTLGFTKGSNPLPTPGLFLLENSLVVEGVRVCQALSLPHSTCLFPLPRHPLPNA